MGYEPTGKPHKGAVEDEANFAEYHGGSMKKMINWSDEEE